ncbi:MAG: ribonuclease H-like domain-containing protein [Lachnospiraceae bacterium]|nr:ribonuclease H-like domain-containing protein [Lachnospiraceae bacterium]
MKTVTEVFESKIQAALFPVPPEKVLFFDIETTGLSPRTSSLYLIGTIHYQPSSGQFQLTQWFADNSRSEREIVMAFLEQLEHFECLCHFNGRTFDISYILQKCDKYDLSVSSHCEKIFSDHSQTTSLDLLIALRPLKKAFGLPHCTQKDFENWCGVCREDKYNGGQLIEVYSQYRQDLLLHPEAAPEKEKLLLLHNHDDLLGMLSVAELLAYRHCLTLKKETPAMISSAYIHTLDLSEHILQIGFSLPVSVPKEITLNGKYPCVTQDSENESLPDCRVTLSDNTGVLSLPIRQDTLKYFIPDYKNYYYLPEEDTAIHCSVAEFVDSQHRKKATAATCYLRKTGLFIPSLTPKLNLSDTPVFFKEYKDKLSYLSLSEEFIEIAKKNSSAEESFHWLVPYVTAQLGCFL